MPVLYEIHWLPDGRVEKFAGSRGNYYEIPNSEPLDIDTIPVWCHQCAKVTHGECLSTLKDIDQQLRDLSDPNSERYRETRYGTLDKVTGNGEQFLQSRVEKLQRLRIWRESRTSPPKCIHCGSTHIVVLPYDEPFPIPSGTETVRLSVVGLCSTNFNEWFFTPEGDRIPRDTRPTYWHHPALDQLNSPSSLLEIKSETNDDTTPP